MQGGARRAYGNYVFGAYVAAGGVPLNISLFAANKYASTSSAYYDATLARDNNFDSLPASNVFNIGRGFIDYMNSSLCHK